MNDLHHKLEQLSELEPVSVEQFSPSDPKEKYQFLQALKSSGFPFTTAYSHGNNVTSISFGGLSPLLNHSFQIGQSVIESMKKSFQAMRRELFSLFGKLVASVKPAVMSAQCICSCI